MSNHNNKAQPLTANVGRFSGDVTLELLRADMGGVRLTPMDAMELARQLTYHAEQAMEESVEPPQELYPVERQESLGDKLQCAVNKRAVSPMVAICDCGSLMTRGPHKLSCPAYLED